MEMFILEECNFHDFNDSQFCFVQGRGTNMSISLIHDIIKDQLSMAISLIHDIISYNVKSSPIFCLFA